MQQSHYPYIMPNDAITEAATVAISAAAITIHIILIALLLNMFLFLSIKL